MPTEVKNQDEVWVPTVDRGNQAQKNMKSIILISLLSFSGLTFGEPVSVIPLSAKHCTEGEHQQPEGPFVIYVFCDDALGTNISVFLKELGAPFMGAYRLTKRFWQSDEWGADVTSFAWLPNNKSILISTSAIYGSGKVYKLDLESQKESVIYSPNQTTCLTEITKSSNNKLPLKITDCELNSKGVEI
jgi:hypothetical protein